MSTSFTFSNTQTFTLTHAKHLASKVATDLKRIQRFYSEPSDARIAQFEGELIELLKGGYVECVTYGFRKDNMWIEPTLKYTAKELQGADGIDDDPGKIRANASIAGASFASFLTYTSKWFNLSPAEQEAVERTLPITRTTGTEPSVNGYFSSDKSYSSGGRSLDRSSVRSY